MRRGTSWRSMMVAVGGLLASCMAAWSAPKMVIPQDKMDGGVVPQGEKKEFVFTVRNAGDAALEIEAKPGWGCQNLSFDRSIPPGGEGKVRILVDTTNMRGKAIKTITVKSNDPDQKADVYLQMTLVSQPYVDALPSPQIYCGEMYEGDTVTKEVTLTSNEAPPFEVTGVETTANYVTTQLTPIPATQPDKPQTYKLKVTVKPTVKSGNFAATLVVRTNSKKAPQTQVTVIGLVQKEITAFPRAISLGLAAPKSVSPLEFVLSIKKHNGTFAITKVEHHETVTVPPSAVKREGNAVTTAPAPVEGPQDALKLTLWLPVDEQAQKQHKEYRLVVAYVGGWEPGFVQGQVKVFTDDPAQPEFIIPLYASVQKPVEPQTAAK